MHTITRAELKRKLERGEPVRLVMAQGPGLYEMAHIPGSVYVNVNAPETVQAALPRRDEEIVVYCSGWLCMKARQAYYRLRALGYRNVRYYAGGLADWEAAGYPLAGLNYPAARPERTPAPVQPRLTWAAAI